MSRCEIISASGKQCSNKAKYHPEYYGRMIRMCEKHYRDFVKIPRISGLQAGLGKIRKIKI
jgi:hypothetical protein